ncbi:type II secretion system F family protein [Vibrio sp. RC27]
MIPTSAHSEIPVYKYRWQGISPEGKQQRGSLIALSQQQAITILAPQQLMITKITERRLTRVELIDQRITRHERDLLLGQFATMLSAGLSVLQIIELTSSQATRAGLIQLLERLRQEIANGSTMAQALARSHPSFKGVISELVKAGESNGQLAQSFERLTLHIEKQRQLITKVKKAMIYPSVVFVVALILAYLMLTQIIPKFDSMFHSLGAELPWFTQNILSISHFLTYQANRVLILTLLLSLLVRYLLRSSTRFQRVWANIKAKLPIIGQLSQKATIARFCQTLSANYHCGIPILEAIDSAARTTNDLKFIDTISSVGSQLSSGTSLHASLRSTDLFPEFSIQIIMVGEESGTLEQALDQVTKTFEQDVENRVDNLEKLIEPLVIVTLGLIVGSLVVAMYLPIFNLMNVLG